MNAASFLNEELKKIDQGVSQKKTLFSFPEFSLIDLLPFAATEEIFFYESKEEDFTFLGLGKSQILETHEIEHFIKLHPKEVLVYQGFFEDKKEALTYVPEWSFVKRNGSITLTIHNSLEYLSPSPSNIIFNSTYDRIT